MNVKTVKRFFAPTDASGWRRGTAAREKIGKHLPTNFSFIFHPAPNLLSLFESPSRMTCNRRLDITVESRKIPKRTQSHSNLSWINERNYCRNTYFGKKNPNYWRLTCQETFFLIKEIYYNLISF